MNLDSFLQDYLRSARNMPGLLADWGRLPGDLREHYRMELALLLARKREAIELAGQLGRAWEAVNRLDEADRLINALAGDIQIAMGFSPFDFVADASVGEPVAFAIDPPDEQLPMAA
jgi:hypothetical protein